MEFLLLTKDSTPVIGQIALVMGEIMNAIFNFFNSVFGIQNIGVAIICYTIIMCLITLPLTIKQTKSTKLMSLMNPELTAIQNKYRGKTDQASQAKMSAETSAVYQRYGTSPTGSCLSTIVQLLIVFALYRVIYNIPAYVTIVKDVYNELAVLLQQQPDFATIVADLASSLNKSVTDTDNVINFLYAFKAENWVTLKELFPTIASNIDATLAQINSLNSFVGGIVLTESPLSNWQSFAIAIPILSGGLQFLSMRLTDTNKQMEGQAGAGMMKGMTTFMPLISVFFTFTFPSGVGLYWVFNSLTSMLARLGINHYMKDIEPEDIIKSNLDKQNKKRAKQGLPPLTEKQAVAEAEKARKQAEKSKGKIIDNKDEREEQYKKSTEYYESKSDNPGSIASRARMVDEYNKKRNKK